MTSITLPRRTGTHADVLLAVGLADLLAPDVYPTEQVRLEDAGGALRVVLPGPLDDDAWRRVRRHAGFEFISLKGERAPAGIPEYPYEEMQARSKRHQETREALRKEKRGREEIEEMTAEERPGPDWPRVRTVRLLQGNTAANKVVRQLAALDEDAFRKQVRAGLPALERGVPSGVGWKADQVQVFNPPAAKGYARLKPDSTDRNDGTSDAWCDPLAEWLRMRGFRQVASAFHFGSKGEHIRVLTPIPANISLSALLGVANELTQGGFSGRQSASEPKMDALAALRLARVLVEHSAEYQAGAGTGGPVWLSLLHRRPSQAISGLHVTHYQSLGQARAVGSLERVGVPGWFAIHEYVDAQAWLDVLEEHRAALLSLEDKHSDEIGLLVAYRSFLQSEAEPGDPVLAEAFLEFLGSYGCFLMRAREGGRRVRQFQTDRVRRVLMGISEGGGERIFTAILDDPGFIAVADAVRAATVNAQGQKSMGVKDLREIRYDLLHDIRRKRSLSPAEFMEALADFIGQYNAENARRREMGKKAQRNVTTEELHSFAALVERHGPAVVGALLGAFGSCRKPRDPDVPAENAEAGAGENGEPSDDETQP